VAGQAQRWEAEDAYRRLAPSVLAYLRAADPLGYEDLFGDVFVKVARSIKRFEGNEDALRRWLFTIAQNQLRDSHRQRMRRPKQAAAPPREEPAPGAPEPFDPDLLAALLTLTDDQRNVVALRFIADLSLEDVAGITKRSVGAVKALQHRALEALSAAIPGGPPRIEQPWQP
jgi:RNA polymerase sigma-70 factor (ECF subfamily)